MREHESKVGAVNTTEFYFVDVGQGNGTFIFTTAGEVILWDTGRKSGFKSLKAFIDEKEIKKIDYLIITHYEDDHYAAVPELFDYMPIENIIDHGPCSVYDKGDEWWMKRRGVWIKEPGYAEENDRMWEEYEKIRSKTNHIVAVPGTYLPIKGLKAFVISSNGETISEPMYGEPHAGEVVPEEYAETFRHIDDCEDARSVGISMRFDNFRLINMGDLSWNKMIPLTYPVNIIGNTDVVIATHHTCSFPKSLGLYYTGVAACSRPEMYALSPRVAVISLPYYGHRVGTDEGLKNVLASPRLEDYWMTEYVVEGAQMQLNPLPDYIANLVPGNHVLNYIHLSANRDGSFIITNSRTDFTKKYDVLK